MSFKKQAPEAQARKIALDVSNRRKAGEVVTDEAILREHPQLRGPLLEQLSRLSRLETARIQAEQFESADGTSPKEVFTDHQGTLDLPLFAEEAASPEIPKTAQARRADKPATPVSVPAAEHVPNDQSELEATAEAPTDEQPQLDELRITLKEPVHDVRNHSTMVLNESGFGEATLAASKIPLYRPSVRAPMAVIKLFHDGQLTFNQYPVMADRFRIGRTDGDLIVPHDYWMSGRHAEIQRRKRGDSYHWFLIDLNSTNGTFVQTDFAVLRNNDELFMGQERYRFLLKDDKARLMHVTRGAGQLWAFTESQVIIGSQLPCGLKSFTSDPYLDAVHARLKREPDGTWTIRDNRSRNGVWYRIKEVEIPANSEFQLGEQRFGFWTAVDNPIKAANLHVASRLLDSSQ